MIPHDRLGAAEPPERLQAQLVRPGCALLAPQPLQHELEVRRLDTVSLDRPLGRAAEVDPARRDLVEHGLDQLRLSAVAGAGELAVALERADDRRPSRAPVEPVETQQVVVQPRYARRQRVQLGQRVAAQRDQHVDAETGPAQEILERLTERAVRAVVEEVLLELIEQEIHLARLLRRGRDGVDETGRRPELGTGLAHGGDDAADRILGPGVVHDHRGASERAQALRDTRADQGALARRRSARRGRSTARRGGWRRSPPGRDSRPKKRSASSSESSKAARPLYGLAGVALIPTAVPRHPAARPRTPPTPCRSPRRHGAARTPARARAGRRAPTTT